MHNNLVDNENSFTVTTFLFFFINSLSDGPVASMNLM